MTKTINHNLFFPHSPEKVWEYLTNSDLMQLWLMKNDFKPIMGHEFTFTTNPIPSLNIDGIFHCQVLEMEPYKKLSYSWKSGPGNGVYTLDSVVVWQLNQLKDGCELILTHSGFPENEHLDLYSGMNNGWAQNIQKILDRLNKSINEN